ncbi:MAG: hypothetical protein EBZ74_10175, partial [Planctomycetia bacterium]|nr:hypothetical protein [Planctomycetia bacterium]
MDVEDHLPRHVDLGSRVGWNGSRKRRPPARHARSRQESLAATPDTPALLGASTARLAAGGHASRAETAALVAGVLDGTVDLAAFGRWLVALADLGESAAEIAGVA